MKEHLKTMSRTSLKLKSGIKISIRYPIKVRGKSVIIVAPGFFQSKETKTFKKLEKDLMKKIDVISMDFRGHGQSSGWYTFTSNEKEDMKAVIDFAKQRYQKIGVLGFSYGGSIAIIEEASFHNIDSIICVGSPMSSEDIEFRWWKIESIRLGLKGCEWGSGVRPGNPFLSKEKPIERISCIHKTPIFFIHGDLDPTVDVRHSQLLFKKAKEPKKVAIMKGGSHAEEMYRQFPKKFIAIVWQWFLKTLDEG